MARIVATVLIGSISLSGCASIEGQGPGSTPSASETAQSARAEIGTSAFDLRCDAVASSSELDSVFGAGPVLATAPVSGVESRAIFATALVQDGALACAWGEGEEAPSARLFALPDAADAFGDASAELNATGDYRELDIFDGSIYDCHYEYPDAPRLDCVWYILASDVWVTVTLKGLLDSALDAQPNVDLDYVVASKDSALVQLLIASVNSILQAPRLELTRSATAVGSCTDLIDTAVIAAYLPGDVVVHDVIAPDKTTLGIAATDEGGPMWTVSMRRLGYRYCSVSPPPSGGYYGTIVTIAPGGAWAFDESRAQPIDGLGPTISECESGQDGPFCLLAAVVGDTLITVEANEGTPLVSLAVIKDVVAKLG